jgi:hypothetical protein
MRGRFFPASESKRREIEGSMTKYSYWLLGALLAAPVVHASDSTSGWQHIGTVTRMKALPKYKEELGQHLLRFAQVLQV